LGELITNAKWAESNDQVYSFAGRPTFPLVIYEAKKATGSLDQAFNEAVLAASTILLLKGETLKRFPSTIKAEDLVTCVLASRGSVISIGLVGLSSSPASSPCITVEPVIVSVSIPIFYTKQAQVDLANNYDQIEFAMTFANNKMAPLWRMLRNLR
jgi:hypothetical protein